MSSGEGLSAADVVNRAPLELIRIFREYGESAWRRASHAPS